MAELVWACHDMLAGLTAIREIRLDGPKAGEESRRLADALQGVADNYQIPITAKQIAIANLFAAMGTIYSPRILAYKLRRANEKAQTSGPVAVPRPKAQPAAERGVPGPAAPPAPPTAPQGFSMPTPANRPDENGTYLNVSPSEIWSEPAAEFPGVG